jgi:hypothetical protein
MNWHLVFWGVTRIKEISTKAEDQFWGKKFDDLSTFARLRYWFPHQSPNRWATANGDDFLPHRKSRFSLEIQIFRIGAFMRQLVLEGKDL